MLPEEAYGLMASGLSRLETAQNQRSDWFSLFRGTMLIRAEIQKLHGPQRVFFNVCRKRVFSYFYGDLDQNFVFLLHDWTDSRFGGRTANTVPVTRLFWAPRLTFRIVLK